MTFWDAEKLLSGIKCEECYPKPFGQIVDDSPENLYLYSDMSGWNRCFCKKHMSYGKKGSPATLEFKDDWDYPFWGAKLLSEILIDLKKRKVVEDL